MIDAAPSRYRIHRTPPSLRSALRAALAMLSLSTLLLPAAAAAAWRQSEFVVGTWLDPPIVGRVEALITNTRNYRVAKDSYVTLFSGWPNFFPLPEPGLTDRDVQKVRFAAAHAAGVRVMVADPFIATRRVLANRPCTEALEFTTDLADDVLGFYSATSLTPEEKQAHAGYFLGDEPHPSSCWVARQRQWTAAIHARDPGQPAWINLLPHAWAYLDQWIAPGEPGEDPVPDVISIAQYPYVNGQIHLPDRDGNGWPDHDGRGFLENIALMRERLGPDRAFWHLADAWNLEHDANTSFDFDDPTAPLLRLFSFAPAASGATGIIFFGYSHSFMEHINPDLDGTPEDPGRRCATLTAEPCSEAAVSRGFIPTRKYEPIRQISHYLKDVVGPVILRSSYRGTWHRDPHLPTGDTWQVPAARCVGEGTPVLESIGDDRLMVGLFQGEVSASDTTWYLLVVNKDPALAPVHDAALTLKQSFDVGAAPSAIGYVGGTGFARVPTVNRSFTVSLEPGEGRLFKLSPPGEGDFLTLLAPAGGEIWVAGEPRTVSWDDPSAAVTVRLFTDVVDSSPELAGPAIELASGVSGGQTTITVPAVASNRARVEISALGGRRASHRAPLKVRAAPAPEVSIWPVARADGFLQCDLLIDAAGLPAVMSFGDSSRRLQHSVYDGSAWSTQVVRDNSRCDRGDETWQRFAPDGSYGYSPSFVGDPSGVRHSAFYTFFNQASGSWGHAFSIHYGSQESPASPWRFEPATAVGSVDGDLALAVNGQGVPHVVYNAGFRGSYEMRVIRKAGDAWEEWGTPYAGNPQHLRVQFDAANRMWITFVTQDPAALHVLRRTDSGTVMQLRLSGVFGSPSLALDSEGNVHVAYTRPGPLPGSAALGYRKYDGTVWSAEEIVDGSVGSIADASVAVAGTSPRIAFARSGVLVLADRSGGFWALGNLDVTSDVDGSVSAEVASTGWLWASYRDRGADRMMVAAFPPGAGGCHVCERRDLPAPPRNSVQLVARNPMFAGDGVRFELRLGRPASVRARLFDALGRIAAAYQVDHPAAQSREVVWNVSRVPPGVYFVEASLDGEVVIRRKLVILR